jgi:hypothetical protein
MARAGFAEVPMASAEEDKMSTSCIRILFLTFMVAAMAAACGGSSPAGQQDAGGFCETEADCPAG